MKSVTPDGKKNLGQLIRDNAQLVESTTGDGRFRSFTSHLSFKVETAVSSEALTCQVEGLPEMIHKSNLKVLQHTLVQPTVDVLRELDQLLKELHFGYFVRTSSGERDRDKMRALIQAHINELEG